MMKALLATIDELDQVQVQKLLDKYMLKINQDHKAIDDDSILRLLKLFQHKESKIRKSLVILLSELCFAMGKEDFDSKYGNEHLNSSQRQLVKIYFEKKETTPKSRKATPSALQQARSKEIEKLTGKDNQVNDTVSDNSSALCTSNIAAQSQLGNMSMVKRRTRASRKTKE